jgi:hypothetical protein
MIISCADLDSFFDGELGTEHAAGFRDHLGGCAACQRVLHGRMQEVMLVDAMHAVRAPDARAVRRKRRVRLAAALAPVLGAAAVGVFTLSTDHAAPRAVPLQVVLSVDPAGPVMRGTSAHPGDVLRVSARGARHRAIWVYKDERELVASCPGMVVCQTTADALDLKLVLPARGAYAVVTLGAASSLPAPSGSLDADLDAASTIDGSYQLGHVDVD